MSFNGSGTFLINTAGQPVVSGTVISSTAFNSLTADLATGLSTAITKDGQTTVTANIPMSTYKFTGLGVGSAATDSANLSQVQSTVTKLLNSVSGADTITATASPTLAAYATGQMFYFVAAGDNTAAVTINIDSLGAKSVTRDGSVALAAADIKSGEVVVVVYDGTRFQVVSQLNSAGDARFANVSIASSLYVGGVSTFVGNAGFSANVSIASALSVGGVAAITGATTIGGNLTLSGGTANGVLYLNGSKVATSGAALTFDGTDLATSGGVRLNNAQYYYGKNAAGSAVRLLGVNAGNVNYVGSIDSGPTEVNYGAASTITAQYWNISGTERMRLDSSGNLGIGTASPSYKLDVRGGAISAGNGTIFGGISYSTRPEIGAISNHPVGFITNNTTQMLLDTSGNLGIGTASPAVKLEVQGSASLALFRNNTSSATTSYITVVNANNSSNGLVMAHINDGTGYLGTQNNAALRFVTNDTERARITAAGDVGIGTSGPPNKLSVIGKISASDSNFTASAYIHASPNSGADRNIGQFSVSGASNGLQINWNHASSKMHIIINNIPTSSAGLPSGTLYSDGGTIKIA